jgi:formylglycine-generating enzyme required for sulfatase activity
VEHVSWDDAVGFCRKLSELPLEREAGRDYRLPTEAEWEYACRAGTTTATYAGDLVYLDVFNAPVLDPIAWYGGNSGVGPEDRTAIDSSGRSGMQHPAAFSATHPVKRKRPNPWGLYDMLGDVWVWCGDWYGDYPSGAVVDPQGPPTGTDRVSRGGSWGLAAWYCRAAERIRNAPGSRWNSLGIRLCAPDRR